MVSISIDSYVKKHCKNYPGEESNKLRERLKQAINDKKNGAICINCGQVIWAIGSAVAYRDVFLV